MSPSLTPSRIRPERLRRLLAQRPHLGTGLRIALLFVLSGILVLLRFVGENRRAPDGLGELLAWALGR